MLTMNGLRMSKSTGNYILPMELLNGDNDFFEKAFSPSVVRFCFMQAHYRSVLDISNEAMVASEKGLTRLTEGIKLLDKLSTSSKSTIDVQTWIKSCYNAMNDDFNTPILIAQLFEGIKYINLINDGKESITTSDLEDLRITISNFVYDILGIQDEQTVSNNSDKLNGAIEMLIRMRNEARANKNWALSDQIRDELAAIGIILKDGKEGTSFTV